MYFINSKIVKSIANEIYREAGFKIDDNDGWYVVYDSENRRGDTDFTVSFAVQRDNPDENFDYKHFVICIDEWTQGRQESHSYTYDYTYTLNRRELADKLLEIIARYNHLKEVSA